MERKTAAFGSSEEVLTPASSGLGRQQTSVRSLGTRGRKSIIDAEENGCNRFSEESAGKKTLLFRVFLVRRWAVRLLWEVDQFQLQGNNESFQAVSASLELLQGLT